MNEQVFLFIFAKGKKVKVLTLSQCKQEQETLLANGWAHTATIDACVWIQSILNDKSYQGVSINELRGC